jgi:23S rRNA (guanosine2251-2'-O)-methyltransferase
MPDRALRGELLTGTHCVEEALRTGRRRLFDLCYVPGKRTSRLAAILAAARQRGLPLQELDAAQMTALCGGPHHQGVALRAAPLPTAALAELVDGLQGAEALVLLLDGLLDPHNLGALVRTALGAGAAGIVLPQDRSAPLSPSVSRASAGALEHAVVVVVPNLVRAMQALKAQGFWLAGLVPRAPTCLFEARLDGRIGLVVGGEEQGIRPLVRRHCDMLLSIPQAGGVDSLNASAAGAVALYEVWRQRRRGAPECPTQRHSAAAPSAQVGT